MSAKVRITSSMEDVPKRLLKKGIINKYQHDMLRHKAWYGEYEDVINWLKEYKNIKVIQSSNSDIDINTLGYADILIFRIPISFYKLERKIPSKKVICKTSPTGCKPIW